MLEVVLSVLARVAVRALWSALWDNRRDAADRFTDVARCEDSIPEVAEFYRPHGADVFAACEILPPPLTVPKSR